MAYIKRKGSSRLEDSFWLHFGDQKFMLMRWEPFRWDRSGTKCEIARFCRQDVVTDCHCHCLKMQNTDIQIQIQCRTRRYFGVSGCCLQTGATIKTLRATKMTTKYPWREDLCHRRYKGAPTSADRTSHWARRSAGLQ